MPGISAVFVFAGLMCMLILVATLLYHRHARTRAQREMKRHLRRIGMDGRYGSAFDPAARSDSGVLIRAPQTSGRRGQGGGTVVSCRHDPCRPTSGWMDGDGLNAVSGLTFPEL
jgi:hypothetical protein